MSVIETLILCPTRDRPDDAVRMAMTVAATSKAKVAFYVDDDQESDYRPLLIKLEHTIIHVGPRIGPVAAMNVLAETHKAQVYGLGVDDCQYLTPGWDDYVHGLINGFQGKIGVVGARMHEVRHVEFPFVSRAWIDQLDWFALPTLYHHCSESVLQMLGEQTHLAWASPTKLYIHHDVRDSMNPDKLQADLAAFRTWCGDEKRMLIRRLGRIMYENSKQKALAPV